MGSLHNKDFGVFWASAGAVLGRKPGSGEPVRGTGSGFPWVLTGFAVPRFGLSFRLAGAKEIPY